MAGRPETPSTASEDDPEQALLHSGIAGVLDEHDPLYADPEAEVEIYDDDDPHPSTHPAHASSSAAAAAAATNPAGQRGSAARQPRFDGYRGHQHSFQHQQQQRKLLRGGVVGSGLAYGGTASALGSSHYNAIRGTFGGVGASWNMMTGNSMYGHGNGGAHGAMTMMRTLPKELSLMKPPRLHRGCPKPVYCYSNDEERAYIILSTSCFHSGSKYTAFNTYGTGANTKREVVRHGGNEGCIYKYDIFNDQWDKHRRYDNVEFRAHNHGMAVRVNGKTLQSELWIFGGGSKMFGYFSMGRDDDTEHIFDVHKHNDMDWMYPTALFLADELHIFGRCSNFQRNRQSMHCIFYANKLIITKFVVEPRNEYIDVDAIQSAFAKVRDKHAANAAQQLLPPAAAAADDDEKTAAASPEHDPIARLLPSEDLDVLMPNFFCCKSVFVEHLQQILLLNGQGDNIYIWCYSFESKKWSIFHDMHDNLIYLPRKFDNNFDVVLIHDFILILCYVQCKEIWCLDLRAMNKNYNTNASFTPNKWSRKTCKDFDGVTDDCSMVFCPDTYHMHFMSTLSPSHYSTWVFYLMPKRIIKRVYAPLVASGYFRLMQKKYKKSASKSIHKNVTNIISSLCCDAFFSMI